MIDKIEHYDEHADDEIDMLDDRIRLAAWYILASECFLKSYQ